jgi:hypothetical protein
VIVHIVKALCQNSSIISLNLALLCQSQLATTAKLVYFEIMRLLPLINNSEHSPTIPRVKGSSCEGKKTRASSYQFGWLQSIYAVSLRQPGLKTDLFFIASVAVNVVQQILSEIVQFRWVWIFDNSFSIDT